MSISNEGRGATDERALDGKIAIVTGGASGIGHASAARFHEAGATVVVTDVNSESGLRAASEIDGSFVRADVSRPEDWTALVDLCERELGGMDVAHLNAGVTVDEQDVTKVSDEQYRRILGTNVDGVFFGLRALVPAMVARGGGAIVVTASLAGLTGFSADPVYTLTKHAVVGLVRSVAPHLEPLGITLNAVCPGMVDTPLLIPEVRDALVEAHFPLIAAEEVADAVLSCVLGRETGQAVVVQAGREAEAYRFGRVPGPRGEGVSGMAPPGILAAPDQLSTSPARRN